jgi:hypothetical protein
MRRTFAVLALILAAFMCTVSPSSAAPSQDAQPSSASLPRIAVAGLRLVNTRTGATFVPRGANYVKLAPTGAGGRSFHATFEPGLYDPAAAAEALRGMARDGYNVVRVYIDPGTTDATSAHGIGRGRGTSGVVHGPYMDNVADFVTRATQRGIYVIPTMDAWPQNDHYIRIVDQHPAGPPVNIGGDNIWYLHPGFVAAKAEYMKQFASALEQRVGRDRMATILAYSANNEVAFDGDKPPYHTWSGTVTALNGLTYDMSNAGRRQQSADASLVEYSRRLKRALAGADHQALLTMGFYTNRAVGKSGFNGFRQPATTTNTRFPGRPAALSQFGAADFIDMHVYPSSRTYDVAADLRSSEYQLFEKPFIIGEIGARKDVYQFNVRAAAHGMRDVQVASCGLGAKGWIFWTWDTRTSLANQDKLYNLMDSNGSINGQVAPLTRPDPCVR